MKKPVSVDLPDVPYPANEKVQYITDGDYMNPSLGLWTQAQICAALAVKILHPPTKVTPDESR